MLVWMKMIVFFKFTLSFPHVRIYIRDTSLRYLFLITHSRKKNSAQIKYTQINNTLKDKSEFKK